MLLALPFLPADEVPATFHRLETQAVTEPLQAFTQYIYNDTTGGLPAACGILPVGASSSSPSEPTTMQKDGTTA